MVRDGRLKLIALSSPERARSLPQAPLIAETLPGFSAMSLIGIIAPAGIPAALMQQISADISAAVKAPTVVERMAQLGMEPVGSTNQAYDQIIRAEIDKWVRVVKTAGIRID
jgi:tripartite-type tricarboxylate transporter receptor subunit TctC